MAMLIVPAKGNMEGPWLIGPQEIEELDTIFQFADKKLSESLKIQIDETVRMEYEKSVKSEEVLQSFIQDATQRYSFKKNKNKIQVSAEDGKKLSDSSLRAILKDPKTGDFTPNEMIARVEHGKENTLDFKISTFGKGKIRYEIVCYDKDIENEIRYEIDKWADKYSPNKASRIWSNHADLFRFLLGGTAFIALLLFFPTSSGSYQEQIKKESRELLNKGITKDNEAEAIKLILTNETKYTPDGYTASAVENKDLKLKVLIISSVLFIFSVIRPKTTIGIGKRKNQYVFYKFWQKFVIVTIPTIFILGPIIELIKSKL